jgi:hypothetical protein
MTEVGEFESPIYKGKKDVSAEEQFVASKLLSKIFGSKQIK